MPIIEEIDDEDIDNMDYDPADFDHNNPFDRSMPVESGAKLRSTAGQTTGSASSSNTFRSSAGSSESAVNPFEPGSIPGLGSFNVPGGEAPTGPQLQREIPEHMKSWSVLYPVYFDATRSHSEGRRVPKDQAVESPLATTILEACRTLGYEAAFELTKAHPRDWANIGRVRVNSDKPKRQLYKQISGILKKTPVNAMTARVEMYQQFAQFDSPNPLAVPRGMKISKTLPGVSPALSASKAIAEAMNPENMGKMFGMGGMGGMGM